MLSILGFLAVLGPLVVVHEFGHYIFARIFGVKAEVFSVGFGPVIFKKQLGETELRLSAIPLGGFVKLLGEEAGAELSLEDQKRALQKQAPWKRFFIFFGGPLFNFLFAILVFMAILVIGEPQISSVIGRVVHGSAAEKAGFVSGDRVLAVEDKPVKKFEDMLNVVGDNPGKPIHFSVLHPQATSPVAITIAPSAQQGYSVYGEATDVGEVDGLLPAARAATVGVSNPDTLAGKAGIKTGDKIVSFNGAQVENWEEIDKLYQAAVPGSKIQIVSVAAKDKVSNHELSFTKPQSPADLGSASGLYSSEMFVDKTVPKSPAEANGMKAGDRLVSVSNLPVQSFFELKDAVQKAGEKDGKVEISWERDGKITRTSITPTATQGRDPVLKKTTQYTVGIIPMLVWTEPATFIERTWNPFTLVYKATERMVVFSWRNIVSIRKMFTGDVSVATLGGPILIGKIAGESLSRGLIAFLTTMAILSVGLGVLNVLPIPVLDGGHLLLLGVESVRGKPLSTRQMEVVQQVGLSLILLLMVIVMKNDIARLPFFE